MKKPKLLVVDDDKNLCYLLKEELGNEGLDVDAVYDGRYAINKIKEKYYDLILLDLEMEEIRGEKVLQFVNDNYPNLQIIVLTGRTDIRTAIECIKLGAYDFISKPYEFEHLLVTIKRALEHKNLVEKNKILTAKINSALPNKIIGESKTIKNVISLATRAAKSESNILLEGETGTGKELFSEFIHQNSNRNNKPLVTVNCASLPDQLMESELFGYEKGAFTDAKSTKQGLVEIANGGTLFLDEIGELSITLQPKLLRFLENGEFRRVGGINTLTSDVRVIGATNKNLMEETEKKNFRRDLLFRLNVITLRIPPLRERDNDIILLADYFLKKKSPFRTPKQLNGKSKKLLSLYNFPGNVRELEHVIERAIIFSDTNFIQPKDLNLPKEEYYFSDIIENDGDEIVPIEDIEKKYIRKALYKFGWNREETARALRISLKTLYTKIKKYNLR